MDVRDSKLYSSYRCRCWMTAVALRFVDVEWPLWTWGLSMLNDRCRTWELSMLNDRCGSLLLIGTWYAPCSLMTYSYRLQSPTPTVLVMCGSVEMVCGGKRWLCGIFRCGGWRWHWVWKTCIHRQIWRQNEVHILETATIKPPSSGLQTPEICEILEKLDSDKRRIPFQTELGRLDTTCWSNTSQSWPSNTET